MWGGVVQTKTVQSRSFSPGPAETWCSGHTSISISPSPLKPPFFLYFLCLCCVVCCSIGCIRAIRLEDSLCAPRRTGSCVFKLQLESSRPPSLGGEWWCSTLLLKETVGFNRHLPKEHGIYTTHMHMPYVLTLEYSANGFEQLSTLAYGSTRGDGVYTTLFVLSMLFVTLHKCGLRTVKGVRTTAH